jgi:sugar O-acyltransferase (sialic acid O-acetyltransferase NeuD family)
MATGSKILLVGGFIEIIELCEALGKEIAGIIDPDCHRNFFGYRVLGTDNDVPSLRERLGNIPVVLTPDSPVDRERLRKLYNEARFEPCTLIHPLAVVSHRAQVGEGAVIQHGAHISALVSLGRDVKVNVRANLMHEVKVGDFSTIAPNAVVLGRVRIGHGAYVGANATILPALSVGDGAVVGAGAVVTRNVPANATVKGNPAR